MPSGAVEAQVGHRLPIEIGGGDPMAAEMDTGLGLSILLPQLQHPQIAVGYSDLWRRKVKVTPETEMEKKTETAAPKVDAGAS